MAEMIQINPDYLKISIYAERQGMIETIASTEPSDIGKAWDSDDAEPILIGELSVAEYRPDNPSTVEILAPYLQNGRPVAAIGLYISTLKRDALIDDISKRVLWITLLGSGFVLIIAAYSVRRIFLSPLRLIASGSDALARGEMGHRLPVKDNDEISQLTASFNTMAASLQHFMEQERSKIRQLGILHESATHLATQKNLDALLDRLVEYPRHLIKSDVAALYLLDPKTGEIVRFKHSGVDLNRYPIQEEPKGTGLLGAFLRDGTSVRLEDIRQDPRSRGLPPHHFPIRNFLGVPLNVRDQVIGGMTVANKSDGTAYTQEDEDLLTTLAFQAAAAVEQFRLFEETQRQAVTDGLTGLFNHRELQKRLQEELDRCKRYGRDFSLLLIDIDFFKSFNDTHGHPFGDLILKEIGSLIQKTVRTMDIPARYGGEEFAVIAPETTSENAKLLAERLRKTISSHSFVTPAGQQVILSVSIGLASFPLDAQDREGLIQASDQALYFAKEAGRNRVCLYGESLKSTIERHQGKLTELLSNPSLRALRDLATAIDAKTPYTRGHSEEVARYAVHLANALGLDEEKKESLRVASLLHNIGTVSIPDRILNKPGPFNVEERKIIQGHPMLAGMILEKTSRLVEILPAILYHHERFDGKGYPNGMKGEEIPYLARVLSVVEAYHAMLSVRPYRPRLSEPEAQEELRRNAGSQFDPAMVETFLNSL
jgi:diguanylate cyclase (GGDEF)-like protein